MRLSSFEVETIKSVILDSIKNAKITLFGSRADDSKRGGDIDLLIESNSEVSLEQKIKILAKLELRGIERKVDLIVKTPSAKEESIFKIAKSEGIEL